MPKLETWLSFASLGLSGMYVALLISFYTFLIGPSGNGPNTVVEPTAVMIQLVSISGAPALIMSGIVFAMTRGSRNRPAGPILIAAGIILIVGIISLEYISPKIPERMMISSFEPVNYAFIAGGVGIVLVGIYQFIQPRNQRRNKIPLE